MTRVDLPTGSVESIMKSYTLIDPAGRPYQSDTAGTLGGHRRGKLYGRLDCAAAARAIAAGG